MPYDWDFAGFECAAKRRRLRLLFSARAAGRTETGQCPVPRDVVEYESSIDHKHRIDVQPKFPETNTAETVAARGTARLPAAQTSAVQGGGTVGEKEGRYGGGEDILEAGERL